MLVGIGIDIVEISEFTDMPKSFFEKIFTEKEIIYCTSKPLPEQHFAARFSAKEAIIKAISGINSDISFQDIEILNDVQGRPCVFFKRLISEDISVEISMSHNQTMATAVAIVEET